MSETRRIALLEQFYQQYLVDRDSARMIRHIALHYAPGTLERLAVAPRRELRRAAVLALGFVGGYESNAVMGRALSDIDRGVRIAAENGIRALWFRDGNEQQRQLLGIVERLNTTKQFHEAIDRADELIDAAPDVAEAWNQRAIALYSLGRFDESVPDCQQALELNAYHFGAASGMGQCFLQLGDHRQALDCFRCALKLNPNLEGVRANIVHLERVLEKE